MVAVWGLWECESLGRMALWLGRGEERGGGEIGV